MLEGSNVQGSSARALYVAKCKEPIYIKKILGKITVFIRKFLHTWIKPCEYFFFNKQSQPGFFGAAVDRHGGCFSEQTANYFFLLEVYNSNYLRVVVCIVKLLCSRNAATH
jgi:hypothetical protein